MMLQLAMVGLGGAIGSIFRYLMQRWLNPVAGGAPAHTDAGTAGSSLARITAEPSFWSAFPLGTFMVNVIGGLLIGVLFSLSAKMGPQAETIRLFGMTGIMGGFTTFSTFSLESIELLKANKPGLFFAYVAGSVVVCLLAAFIGIKLIRS
ncbi:MAG: CrcB family protein [Chitinophagaceae bacterium]